MIIADERVARFVGERCGTTIYPPWTAMGMERNGHVFAGVVFNCFTGHDCEITIAGHSWTREFIRAVRAYVFDQLGCLRASITTEQPTVVRLAERFGGQVEGMKRNFYGPGRDAYLVGILKEEWAIT